MNEIEIENRLTRVEERAKSNNRQIEDLKPVIGEIHTMSRTMVVLAEQVKSMTENMQDLSDKVDTLEEKPSARIEQIKTAVISALAAAVFSGIASAVLFAYF